MNSSHTIQAIILLLNEFWNKQGCILMNPYDVETGAGTMNPMTTLRTIGPEEWNVAYVEPSRRPADGRYGENPNRLYQHHQYQVILKPSPDNVEELYLASLEALGINPLDHDIRFVEDNWEAPTLGAWGLGWEIWLDGMEVTQFTYFQQVGGIECQPVSAELTYGIERIASYLQDVEEVFDIVWNKKDTQVISYADVHRESEYQFSKYHFEIADTEKLFRHFDDASSECKACLDAGLPLPAYDQCMIASHAFNVLDARKAVSQAQRQNYILKVRELATGCAQLYKEQEAERLKRIQG